MPVSLGPLGAWGTTMRILITTVFVCLAAVSAHAQLDPTLLQEMHSWKAGDRAPLRLLKFPNGDIPEFPMCGLRVVGDSVEDYLAEVDNPLLLEAVMLDWNAQEDSALAAGRRLIRLEGPAKVRALLSRRRLAAGEAWLGGTAATLEQLLQSPYLTLQVARIDYTDMPQAKARLTLNELKAALESGTSWKVAYGAVSQAHPQRNESASCPGTVVAYAFDGIASEWGFDLLTGTFSPYLRHDHLHRLFDLGAGTHILETNASVYLYHVNAVYPGAAAS